MIRVAVLLIVIGCATACSSPARGHRNSRYESTLLDRAESSPLDRDEAIATHWDEIKKHFNGTDEIDACSLTSGNCYSLEADIVGGDLDTIYFANGGSLSFSTGIDEFGSASDSDENGNLWDFTVDMNSPAVDSAVEEWAESNGHTIN